MPVAEVPIRYQGWKGLWRIGIADQLPAPYLIGIDLTEHVKSVLMQTHSQQKGKAKEKCNIHTELVGEGDSTAELIPIKIPQANTFKKEQRADPTLDQCLRKLAKVS